jgi:hypothetical protein
MNKKVLVAGVVVTVIGLRLYSLKKNRSNVSSMVDEYIINTKHDAEQVLKSLKEGASKYGSVTVADYYDSIGIASYYTDNDHGWTAETFDKAKVVKWRRGYTIKFPPVEVL